MVRERTPIPPELSSRRFFGPALLILVAVDMAFIAYGTNVRMNVFEQAQEVLYPNPPADLSSLRAALKPLTIEEYNIPPTGADQAPLARFLLPRISMLLGDARYDAESEQIESITMLFFLSEEVDLATGEGIGNFQSVQSALLIMVTSLMTATGWYWAYPRLPSRVRALADIAFAVATIPLLAYLAFATANLYLFAW